MKPALLIVHRDSDGSTTNLPFTYKTGEMMAVVEAMVDYIVGLDLVDSVWEAVAADRLGAILDRDREIRDLKAEVKQLKADLGLWTGDRVGVLA